MTILSIPEMSCGHCKASVDPAAKVAVDFTTRRADISSISTTAALIAALKVAGYEAKAK